MLKLFQSIIQKWVVTTLPISKKVICIFFHLHLSFSLTQNSRQAIWNKLILNSETLLHSQYGLGIWKKGNGRQPISKHPYYKVKAVNWFETLTHQRGSSCLDSSKFSWHYICSGSQLLLYIVWGAVLIWDKMCRKNSDKIHV